MLLSHPAVVDAAAFPLTHPRLGEDVAAAVVLGHGKLVTAHELRAFVGGRLRASRCRAVSCSSMTSRKT